MKNLLTLTLCLLLVSLSAAAQYDPDKIDKKAVAFYNRGLELANAEKYKEAIASLNETIRPGILTFRSGKAPQ